MESAIKGIESEIEMAKIVAELVKQGVNFVATKTTKSNGEWVIEFTGGY